MSEAEQIKVAYAILRYLEEHPAAKDTLDGIAGWWLLREYTRRKVDEIEGAVRLLVSNDLLVETRRADTQPYYCINQERSEQIRKILHGGSAIVE